MDIFSKRCGCGAVFKLVGLRDRSTRCVACDRNAGGVVSERPSHDELDGALNRLSRDLWGDPEKIQPCDWWGTEPSEAEQWKPTPGERVLAPIDGVERECEYVGSLGSRSLVIGASGIRRVVATKSLRKLEEDPEAYSCSSELLGVW